MSHEDFTEAQQALIEKIAYRVGEVIEKRLSDSFSSGLRAKVELHIATCTVKTRLEALENKAKGAWYTMALQAGIIVSLLTLAAAIWLAAKTH